jgi:hypothetical protein
LFDLAGELCSQLQNLRTAANIVEMVDLFGSLVIDEFGANEFALEEQVMGVVDGFFVGDQGDFEVVVAFFRLLHLWKSN